MGRNSKRTRVGHPIPGAGSHGHPARSGRSDGSVEARAATAELRDGCEVEPEGSKGKGNGVANFEVASDLVLSSLRLSRRQVCKGVTLWPLSLAEGSVADAARGAGELWPLEEALEDGWVGVSEPEADGSVRVESRAPAPIWVAQGEAVGVAGLAAGSQRIPPHASVRVPVAGEGDGHGCTRCSRDLARGFVPVPEMVGFVVAVHDRAVGLELVLPAGPLGRRLPRRVEAWGPFLFSPVVEAGEVGLESPEALLVAAFDPEAGVAAWRGAQVALLFD